MSRSRELEIRGIEILWQRFLRAKERGGYVPAASSARSTEISRERDIDSAAEIEARDSCWEGNTARKYREVIKN